MEEKIKTFRFTHGKSTYRMAWVVEFCLFFIALSLAAFNIVFGLQEGDLVTGLLLGAGWLILAVIELSIIPMAGSFRLAKGINKFYSGFGLVGLLFLSSFTVYEFNEIASEYMTRGARKNAMTVEKLEGEINTLRGRIGTIEETSSDVKKAKRDLLSAKEEAIEIERERHAIEKAKTNEYYAMLLDESDRNNEFPIYNPEEKRRLERTNEQLEDYNQSIEKLVGEKNEVLQNHRQAALERNKPKIEQLTSQIEAGRIVIAQLNSDKDVRIDEATGGILRSKESVVAKIQSETRKEVSIKNNEIQELEKEISMLKMHVEPPEEVSAIDDKIVEFKRLSQEQLSRKKEIERAANERMDAPEFKKIIEENHDKMDRVYLDRMESIETDLKTHENNISKIEDKYSEDLRRLEQNSLSESERFSQGDDLGKEIVELTNKINGIIEETGHEYERTMYFRMASWFSDESSTGFGRLPKKEDYNKVLRYIFAPIGLFFGMTSIILAYLGTGFMFEESRKHEKPIDVEELKRNNKKLKEEIESLSKEIETKNAEIESNQRSYSELEKRFGEAENDKENAIAIVRTEFDSKVTKAELKAANQEMLQQQIADLKRQLELNEADLIKAKQRAFDVIKSIPQTITIVDESTGKKV